jgi:hypothetical protein
MAQSDAGLDTVYFGDEEDVEGLVVEDDVLGDGWDAVYEGSVHATDATNLNVAEVVARLQLAPVECPEEERTGDGDNLIDPFPLADMGLDRSEYSDSSFTGSEATDVNHENFHMDSKGRKPEDVFALASVPLKDVAEKQAAQAERKKQARVAAGKAEDDSEGEESSEDASSEDASSEDASSEDASSEDASSHESSHAAKKQRTDDV